MSKASEEELGLDIADTLEEWLSKVRIERYKNDEYDILEDICIHGCSSGVLGEVIYYNQSHLIFKEFEEEIFDIIKEYEEDTGYNIVSKLWKEQGYYEGFIQQLVWLSIETTADKLYSLQPYIVEDEEEE